MNYDWLDKRSPRSVDQLRLWSENPRLDPEEEHVRTADFVADLLEDSSEKAAFIDLIRSIATRGFMPIDPIIVWQDKHNGKFYVAEGNRRVLALKLLRNADKAPKSIRSIVKQAAKSIDANDIAKVKVVIAPSFDACEWYINQRHSFSSSLQRRWSRLQQQRWIEELYDKYNKDISLLLRATNLTKGEIISTLRILRIRDLALKNEILSQLTKDDQEKVKSHRIPMTILERWFFNTNVRNSWGLIYYEDKVNFKPNINIDSFYNAYAEFIRLVIHRKDTGIQTIIDTRTIDPKVNEILDALPQVTFNNNEQLSGADYINSDDLVNHEPQAEHTAPKGEDTTIISASQEAESEAKSEVILHNNTNRNRMVLDTGQLITSSSKLNDLYNELKEIPIGRYPNCVATALRVFLDLAVDEYYKSNGLVETIESQNSQNKSFNKIELKPRLEFLKQNSLKNKQEAVNVIKKLLNNENERSLDTLNLYVRIPDQGCH